MGSCRDVTSDSLLKLSNNFRLILVSCSNGVTTTRQQHLRKSCICTLYQGPDPTCVGDKRESTLEKLKGRGGPKPSKKKSTRF